MSSLEELQLNRNLYRTQPQTVETLSADQVASNLSPAPSTAIASGNSVQDVNTNAEQINGDTIAPGTIPPATLDVSNWGWTQTCAFSVVDADTVQWGAGTFTSANGLSYSISSGNTGNMSALTYVYLDLNVSKTAYQTTTNVDTPVGVGKVLIAVCQNGSSVATFNQVQAHQIVGDNIIANTINASKMSVGQLSAITADLGTITAGTITGVLFRTATTGERIEITSSPHNLINFYDSTTLYGQLEVYKTGSDGYIKLTSQDGAGLNIYTGIGASSFGSASLNGQGASVDVSGNATNSYSSFTTLNGGSLILHGGSGGDEIYTDDGSGGAIGWVNALFTGEATFEQTSVFQDTITYNTTPMPRVFHGYVNSGASAGTPFPSGWSVSSPATGRYTITHNLSSTDYSVVATAQASAVKNITIESRNSDTFVVRIANLSDTLENNNFMFILCRTV